MKKFTISILLLLISLPILAQERKIEQVDENLYIYRVFDDSGRLQQKGFYKNIDGTLFEHGIWIDNFGTKAEFQNGTMVWIQPKGQKRYTSEEIQLHRLKRKVEMLEAKLTSL